MYPGFGYWLYKTALTRDPRRPFLLTLNQKFLRWEETWQMRLVQWPVLCLNPLLLFCQSSIQLILEQFQWWTTSSHHNPFHLCTVLTWEKAVMLEWSNAHEVDTKRLEWNSVCRREKGRRIFPREGWRGEIQRQGGVTSFKKRNVLCLNRGLWRWIWSGEFVSAVPEFPCSEWRLADKRVSRGRHILK